MATMLPEAWADYNQRIGVSGEADCGNPVLFAQKWLDKGG
ncbi:hypothetical protein Q31a_34930 [Aureliella helgolandensis]|uniref:Uncharacterized protein n=1 Tax=Aureliella helgolandensis TaxID=2527968 RepID=A0A518G9C3_9BACT|nr:hypothetical protein Q31a_34930 [Aureliella helgolandensis]